MNPMMALIIIVLVLGMVLLGGNPLETKDGHKPGGGDPLVSAIEEYNSKTKDNSSMFGMHMPVPTVTNGAAQRTAPAPQYAPYNNQSGQNPYAASNPFNRLQQGINPQQPAQQQPSQGQGSDSYYPPPPLSGGQPASPLQGPAAPRSELTPSMLYQLPMNLPPQPNTTFTVAGGKRIGFMGTAVYTVDAKGRPAPMPDGEYAMFNGLVHVVVRNGQRIILHQHVWD